jgi:hypothetical protein
MLDLPLTFSMVDNTLGSTVSHAILCRGCARSLVVIDRSTDSHWTPPPREENFDPDTIEREDWERE